MDRKELKRKGKEAFKRNYWSSVIVALIFMVLTGGSAGTAVSSVKDRLEDVGGNTQVTVEGDAQFAGNFTDALNSVQNEAGEEGLMVALGILMAAITGIIIFSAIFKVLVRNPLRLGCKYFFLKNSRGEGSVSDIGRGFKPAWWKNVVTLLLSDIYICLWTALFVIPGIIKTFSYAMVPYIRAENPDMGSNEVITLSRKMMDGRKMKYFILGLSFFGWFFLGALTLGILNVFYVNPYYDATMAEFYEEAKAEMK